MAAGAQPRTRTACSVPACPGAGSRPRRPLLVGKPAPGRHAANSACTPGLPGDNPLRMPDDAITREPAALAATPDRREPLAPAAPAERVVAIDVLRGLAVFGILVVNMAYFSGPTEWATNPGRWPSAADRAAAYVIRWLAEGKFYLMFSLLFGLGMFIQMERADVRGVRFVPLHLRRMGVLLAIGLAHLVLLWCGDILHCYALLGFVLVLFRRVSDRWLARWTMFLAVLPLLTLFGFTAASEAARADPQMRAQVEEAERAERQRLEALTALTLEAYSDRSLRRVLEARLAEWSFHIWALAWSSPLILAAFLLGVLVGRHGVLHEPDRHRRLLRFLAQAGIPLGLALNLGYVALLGNFDPSKLTWTLVGGIALYTIGGPLLSFGYVAALLLALRREAWLARLAPLAAVGRTALSNYLLQSLVCTTIFYGYGLGLYGRVGPAAGLLLTLAVFAAQTALSMFWTRRFRFGPAEWLWRSLTYGRLQPLRLTAA